MRSARSRAYLYIFIASFCLLGFWTPWDALLHLDHGQTLWIWLASAIGRAGWLSFNAATIALLVLAIVLAVSAATFQTLRSFADAPRAPRMLPPALQSIRTIGIALPILLHVLALSLLLPPTGALFVLITVPATLACAAKWGHSLLESTVVSLEEKRHRQVPTELDRMKVHAAILPNLAGSAVRHAYMWGAAISFAVLGWRYNSLLVTQGILVSLGASLIFTALLPRRHFA